MLSVLVDKALQAAAPSDSQPGCRTATGALARRCLEAPWGRRPVNDRWPVGPHDRVKPA